MLGTYLYFLYKYILKQYRYLKYTPPKGIVELKRFTGKFTYTKDPRKKGFVVINPSWLRDNIVKVDLPIIVPLQERIWTIHCHKKVANNLRALFYEYLIRHYDERYPIYQLGCFVPRHKMSDTSKSLSLHAYGVALDINWKHNKLGTRGNIPKEIILRFKQYGWNWGGLWTKPKDPMHFQYIQPMK